MLQCGNLRLRQKVEPHAIGQSLSLYMLLELHQVCNFLAQKERKKERKKVVSSVMENHRLIYLRLV
jgi:hypothetical protein